MSDAPFQQPPEGAVVPRRQLRAEFVLLYAALPLGFALLATPGTLFPMLFILMLVGFALLHLTPGFRWRMLLRGRVDWPVVLGFFGGSFLAITALVHWLTPGTFLAIPRARPEFMLVIGVFYPLLSALPQEVVFRALYFRRYRPILPRGWPGILLNAAIFATAHLMYWNWIAVAVTFFGGIAFAYGYKKAGGFVTAFLMHAVGGLLLFFLGLGRFFFSGAVVRPF